MGTSKLAEATRSQLTSILKAWCLIVEYMAAPEHSNLGVELVLCKYINPALIKDKSQEDLEAEYLVEERDIRQVDRWMSGQIVLSNRFVQLNNKAIECGWMEDILGKLLVDAYLSRSSTLPNDAEKCGWDQMAAVDMCESFAKSNKLSELELHCQRWKLSLVGPDENDADAIDAWLDETNDQFEINALDDLKETIQIHLDRAIAEAFKDGINDPYPLIKQCLKESKRSWSDVKELLIKDREKERLKNPLKNHVYL